jgi:UDP-N-acetylmuramyl pentapeptide phosphotransferase/UDP-N-acetylglucosamine-1-phosphate transferase
MKRVLKFLFAIPLLMLLLFATSVVAQPGGRQSAKHTRSLPPANGGSAPIGGGIFILLAMAAGYGIKKIFDARNSVTEEVSSE